MDNESRSTHFGVLFEAALQAYEKKTDITLPDHPLAVQLHNCRSIESITAVLLGEAQAFKEFRGSASHEIDQECRIDFIQTFCHRLPQRRH